MAGLQPSDQAKKRILVIDDHPVFRSGIIGLIRAEEDLLVCGEAASAREGFSSVQQLQPDLLLMDLGLPDKSGLDLLKDVRSFNPDLPVLVISMHDETIFAERVLRAGGRGYLMKQEGPDKIISAIRRVLAGKIALSERASERMLDLLGGKNAGRTSAAASPISVLSDREFEVLRLIGSGKDTHEVAAALNLSTKTVDTHRAHIREKLGLKNGTEVIHYATKWVNEQA